MKRYFLPLWFLTFLFIGCSQSYYSSQMLSERNEKQTNSTIQLVVLGIAQDAGFPQANCQKDCCAMAWKNPQARKRVSCLGIQDVQDKNAYLLDATPDFKDQLNLILANEYKLGGIFLTHAHIGHYTGLMHLGREAMGTNKVPVYAMPRMSEYLTNNGPWSQLVSLNNIELLSLKPGQSIILSDQLTISPLIVPHREEYSETVGFLIHGPIKSALFIPDIDKWNLWDQDILELIRSVDYAFLDGSFYKNGEIPNRDMTEIPHPFIQESIALFSELREADKAKVYFIHFNHTNPVLDEDSASTKFIVNQGFNISREGMILNL